ncbi:carbamoyl transferase [Candidatus Magnetomorum sp. HK-1]|nr:carbamoyl transferase [Candidatus Magnetomorum sp. HK-1]
MKPRKIYIGHANSFHDPAIAIIENNAIYAEAIERHTQCKRAMEISRLWYSEKILKTALNNLGIWPVKDADIINISSWDLDLLIDSAQKRGDENIFCEKNPNQIPFYVFTHTLASEPLFVKQLAGIIQEIPPKSSWLSYPMKSLDNNNFHSPETIPHHLAHAANAVYTSPFDECVALVVDDYGEKGSIVVYHFSDNKFTSVYESDHLIDTGSLGGLYMAMTDLCGFDPWKGEEWKVMGLAPYGKYQDDLYQVFRDNIKTDGFTVKIKDFRSPLKSVCSTFRQPGDPDVMLSADLAYNFQKRFEEIIIDIAKTAADLSLSDNLAYGGGCALNSSANGKILSHTAFKHLHIPCAPADDGNSLGAALYKKYHDDKKDRETKITSPYLGRKADIQKLKRTLDYKSISFEKARDENDLCTKTAQLLSDGKIIGWFQGSAEFGPRALGNRSILANPGLSSIKQRINDQIKFREWYRPLAPSILHEFGSEYFENYQESPYMERTLVFKKEVWEKIPAVVHENGTGRLQTVKKEWNPLYYQLIRTFYEKTGIPLILNTSLNIMGRPIVHSVEDAITVLFTTGLDYMIIENYIIYQ